MKYTLDIKIYETVYGYECPFRLTPDLYRVTPEGSFLRKGYHTIVTEDKDFADKFVAWAGTVSFIKVIGTSW